MFVEKSNMKKIGRTSVVHEDKEVIETHQWMYRDEFHRTKEGHAFREDDAKLMGLEYIETRTLGVRAKGQSVECGRIYFKGDYEKFQFCKARGMIGMVFSGKMN